VLLTFENLRNHSASPMVFLQVLSAFAFEGRQGCILAVIVTREFVAILYFRERAEHNTLLAICRGETIGYAFWQSNSYPDCGRSPGFP
jgi:hypothetical protein